MSVGESVVDVARSPLRVDQSMPTQHGQMLREVRCLQPRLILQSSHAHLWRGREELQDADAERMCKTPEESRLHFVERTLAV